MSTPEYCGRVLFVQDGSSGPRDLTEAVLLCSSFRASAIKSETVARHLVIIEDFDWEAYRYHRHGT